MDGAQLYPFCINLEITGSGTDVPAGTLGTALYTDTDPGILINIYVDDPDCMYITFSFCALYATTF